GRRNAELVICHEKYELDGWPMDLIEDATVGVDSGQVLFANESSHKEYLAAGEDVRDAFYERCCKVTCNSDLNAGIVSNMPVSESGLGDGCYNVFVARNDEKQIVAASVEFISESEIDDEEE
ncbi:MAG: DUF4241 domain-containing protein, partial [Butyrivibrio sp.]|nr:DUF4241 domain-containing protein [Butyrivibrio sp.]